MHEVQDRLQQNGGYGTRDEVAADLAKVRQLAVQIQGVSAALARGDAQRRGAQRRGARGGMKSKISNKRKSKRRTKRKSKKRSKKRKSNKRKSKRRTKGSK